MVRNVASIKYTSFYQSNHIQRHYKSFSQALSAYIWRVFNICYIKTLKKYKSILRNIGNNSRGAI